MNFNDDTHFLFPANDFFYHQRNTFEFQFVMICMVLLSLTIKETLWIAVCNDLYDAAILTIKETLEFQLVIICVMKQSFTIKETLCIPVSNDLHDAAIFYHQRNTLNSSF